MPVIKTNFITACENLFDMERKSCKRHILLEVMLDAGIGDYRRILPLTSK